NPMKLPGPWKDGYVLDYHTTSSAWTGDPYRYDTKRTELGDRVYGLKYGGAAGMVTDIADTVTQFMASWNPKVDCIVPAPPSRSRAVQPVAQIARELGARLGLPVREDVLVKARETPQMKNIGDWSQRAALLAEAIQAGSGSLTARQVLLVDDLIESGATLR